MVSLRTRVGSGIGVLLLFLPAACATRPLDPWTDFAQSVMESARTGDVDALTRDLTLYRWEEITEFYRQASVVDVTRGQTPPAEKELYAEPAQHFELLGLVIEHRARAGSERAVIEEDDAGIERPESGQVAGFHSQSLKNFLRVFEAVCG